MIDFTCECGLKLKLRSKDEFPVNCKCGKTTYYKHNIQEIPDLDDRINLTNIICDNKTPLNDITACITTYKRVGCLERLVESIQKYYPNLKIDVVDTKGNLSWGRNELVNRCTTKYCLILEDDFEFTDNTQIEILIEILEQDEGLGVVGGEIINDTAKRFQGRNMNFFRGIMEYTIPQYPDWQFINNIRYRYCDLISNFFLAKRECLINNPWDEELSLLEHIPWFWTLKQQGQYKVAYTNLISIQHHKDRSDPEYNEKRNNVKKYKGIIENKYGIKTSKILKHDYEYICKSKSSAIKPVIYSLWIGPKLPRLQNLCIKSWLNYGYDYKLFAYEDIDNVPDDVDILDGSEFIQEIYLYQDKAHFGNPALHANYFRYKWLYENGGTWVDIDTACIHPLPDNILIFSSEPVRSSPYWHPNVAVTRVERKNKIMDYCVINSEKQFKNGCRDRGFFGPKLIKYALVQNNMFNVQYVSMPEIYCPYPWWMTADIYRPHTLSVPIQSTCIHLWNNSCVKKDIDVSEIFDKDSMYERLWSYLGVM